MFLTTEKVQMSFWKSGFFQACRTALPLSSSVQAGDPLQQLCVLLAPARVTQRHRCPWEVPLGLLRISGRGGDVPEAATWHIQASLPGDITAAIRSGFLKRWHRFLMNSMLLGETTLPRPPSQ